MLPIIPRILSVNKERITEIMPAIMRVNNSISLFSPLLTIIIVLEYLKHI